MLEEESERQEEESKEKENADAVLNQMWERRGIEMPAEVPTPVEQPLNTAGAEGAGADAGDKDTYNC